MTLRRLSALFSLASAAGLTAQSGPTYSLSTLSDYGVTADDGVEEHVDGLPGNTAITAPLDLRATARGVVATTHAALTNGRNGTATLRITESGSAINTDAKLTRLAATIDEAGPTHSGPHTLRLLVENTTSTTGTLVITWFGRGTGGGEATCKIDTNDDQVPDFEGTSDGRPVVRTLTVTRVTRNFIIDVTGQCEAEVEGRGFASYASTLSITFHEGGGGSCTLTAYGAECGGRLAGSAQGQDVTLSLTGASADSVGLLFLGDREVDIGIGRCSLLTLPHAVQVFRTDAQGNATHELRVPGGVPASLRAQDLLVGGSGVATSNGVRIECR